MAEERQSNESGSKGGLFDGLTGGPSSNFNDLTDKSENKQGGVFSGITGGETGGFRDLVSNEDGGRDKGSNEGGLLGGIRGGESGGVQELTDDDADKRSKGFSDLTGGKVGGFDDITQEGKTPGAKAKFIEGVPGEGKGSEDSRPARVDIHN